MSVREAAERILAECEANKPLDYAEVKRVCRAYLSEHQADDNEPITVGFAYSILPSQDDEYIQLHCSVSGKICLKAGTDDGWDYVRKLENIKTKGQFRMLVELLGGNR